MPTGHLWTNRTNILKSLPKHQTQWQSKEFPVCESVISMEIESELEEKNVPLDLMQSRHNATLHLFWRLILKTVEVGCRHFTKNVKLHFSHDSAFYKKWFPSCPSQLSLNSNPLLAHLKIANCWLCMPSKLHCHLWSIFIEYKRNSVHRYKPTRIPSFKR
jgi:hypothetical protein